ncbi:MAG: DUF2237 domain-containing protein [Pseudomonadota bacterium]
MNIQNEIQLNVFGEKLESCCHKPLTGYFRNGLCETDASDFGAHTVCAVVTDEFLLFSQLRGNDLITPRPEFDFPGLRPGDCWCLCASRWLEAHQAGKAPKVKLKSTNQNTLTTIEFKILREYAIDLN